MQKTLPAARTFSRARTVLALLLPALMVLVVILLPRSVTGAPEKLHVTVGFSASAYTDTSKEKAQAISALWTSLVAREWNSTSETIICSSLAEFEQGIRIGKFDLVVLVASEYLAIRDKVPLEPLFVSARDTDIYDRLILVVRNDSGYRSLADLKGKTLLQQKGLDENDRNIWLETLLLRMGKAAPERYFSSIRKVTKPSGAVLPVFFGKADACIVTKRSLEVMAELNPQLKQELTILEISPQRPSSILAVRKGITNDKKETLRKVLGSLDQSTEGKQLLTLFKMNRLEPYQSRFMVPMEKLFRQYHDLKRRTARRTRDAC